MIGECEEKRYEEKPFLHNFQRTRMVVFFYFFLSLAILWLNIWKEWEEKNMFELLQVAFFLYLYPHMRKMCEIPISFNAI